ncbi:MAG: hypothetical protein LBI33_12850 [Propionibacteriaceae bacterium]|nr:hypothetical protein [Propionibacteriaceae bacterium]
MSDDSFLRFSEAKSEMKSAQAEISARLKAVQAELDSANARVTELSSERKQLLTSAVEVGITVYQLSKLLGVNQPVLWRVLGKGKR